MKRSQNSLKTHVGCIADCSNFSCPKRQTFEPLAGAERLVGMGFRCWISGYQTGDIRSWERGWSYFAKELGPEKAKIAVTELTGWARSICCYAELGVRLVPIVARGKDWANGAVFRDVARVAGFEWGGHNMLAPSG